MPVRFEQTLHVVTTQSRVRGNLEGKQRKKGNADCKGCQQRSRDSLHREHECKFAPNSFVIPNTVFHCAQLKEKGLDRSYDPKNLFNPSWKTL